MQKISQNREPQKPRKARVTDLDITHNPKADPVGGLLISILQPPISSRQNVMQSLGRDLVQA